MEGQSWAAAAETVADQSNLYAFDGGGKQSPPKKPINSEREHTMYKDLTH